MRVGSLPEKLRVSSGGIELYAESWGSGEPTLIFAHGFGGSARNFRPQARAMSTEHRVVLFDARGHARSDAPSDPNAYEPQHFVDDVGAVLDACQLERAIIGGLSMGAGIALRFALQHPERVTALSLAAFPRPHTTPGHVEWALAFADAIDTEGIEAAGARYAWGERFRRDPKAADLIRVGFLEHAPGALASVLRRVIAVQPSPAECEVDIRGFTSPMELIVGSEDGGSLGPSRELSRLAPQSTLVEVAGGGHVVNLTNPAEFNAALRDLIGSLS